MALEFEFTFVKAVSKDFKHSFPKSLTSTVFKDLKDDLCKRTYLHVIKKHESISLSKIGVEYRVNMKWGAKFVPNVTGACCQYTVSVACEKCICRDQALLTNLSGTIIDRMTVIHGLMRIL